MSYVLRYAFDPGSGICLWSVNDAANQDLGYAVEHWQLPLNENTKRYLDHLVAWFDTSIDWSYPSETADHWVGEEIEHFRLAAKRGLALLASELSNKGYEFLDATGDKGSI